MKVVVKAGALLSVVLIVVYTAFAINKYDTSPSRVNARPGFRANNGPTSTLPDVHVKTSNGTAEGINCQIPSLSLFYDLNCVPCKSSKGIHLITNIFPASHPR